MTIDLNCDMGEEILMMGKPIEDSIMPLITSANIACGKHAGNKDTMKMCVDLAVKHNVAIGAHPSYDDRENFGRIFRQLEKDELYQLVAEQILSLLEIARNQGSTLTHVKPHGALYNAACHDPEIAAVVVSAVSEVNRDLCVFGLPKSQLEADAHKQGIKFVAEAFPDRGYNNDGTLTSRNLPGAVITRENELVKRATRMIREKQVETITGAMIDIHAQTFCIHGDNPGATTILMALHAAFRKEGISVKGFRTGKNPS